MPTLRQLSESSPVRKWRRFRQLAKVGGWAGLPDFIPMDSTQRLEEVARSGGPAQAAHARRLLDRLDLCGEQIPQDLHEEVALLYDAFLHDPYLTKYPPTTP